MNKIKRFIPFILIGIVILFSLGKTLQYYFYTDDFVFLYNLRNNLEFGWPYSSVLSIFRPVYQVFGINPLPYFTMAVITYFLASVSVFFFAKALTKNLLVSSAAAIIFATGYIGLDQFSMIAVSIINNLNVINISIALILLINWIETRKLRYYFLTFFMFWFSLLLFPHRAYPLVLFVPTLEFVKSFQPGGVKKMFRQIAFIALRYVPFFFVAVQRGVFSYGTHGTNNVDLFNLIETDSRIYTLFNPVFSKEFFAVFGKLVLLTTISDFFKFVPSQDFYSFVGVFTSLVIILLFTVLYKRKKYGESRVLFAAFLLTIQSYVGNMFLNVDFDANGPVNRYLTISFLFYSVLISLFVYLLLQIFTKIRVKVKNRVFAVVVLFLILVLTSLSRNYEERVIEDRSEPAIKFFKELKAYVPALSDSNYSIFYFDKASYYPVSSRFGNVLLSAAMGNSVNLALPYGVSADSIKIVDNFDDFLRLVFYPPEGKKTVYYTFYNDENGLQNTTDDVFSLLESGGFTVISSDKITYKNEQGINAVSINTVGVSSLTPLSLRMSLQATPLPSSAFAFPYSFNASLTESISESEKEKIFKYLLSREKYYESVRVQVESIHVGKKNPASYLVDDNPDTNWISDQSRWEVGIKPWIKIDLSEERSIGTALWRQSPSRAVEDFTINVSSDGENWTGVKNLSKRNIYSDNSLVAVDFNPVNARYVMLTIVSLSTGPGPSLAEIELLEDEFNRMDIEKAFGMKDNPFASISDVEEVAQAYAYLEKNAKLKIKTFTNKDDPVSSAVLGEIPIFLDGAYHDYEFQIPQGGTHLKEIRLEANFPASFNVSRVLIENLSKEKVLEETRKKCLEFTGIDSWRNPFDCS